MSTTETKSEETTIVPASVLDVPVVDKGPEDIFVFAENPAQMKKEQERLVGWAGLKLESKKAELAEATTNLELAKKRKWKSSTFQDIVDRAQKKVEFYEKMKAALDEGYYIIPDMDVQLFAIRTTRKSPKRNQTHSKWNLPANQESSRPPLGEGRYVNAQAKSLERTDVLKHEAGKEPEYQLTRWAHEFDEEIDFPFKFAKPEIMNATANAMALKIFDEVGILPRSRGADPMIVGRITHKQGYNRKSVNFLIAWFLDTKEL